MENYLAFVVVYNLLPDDYDDRRIERIEGVINLSVSAANDKWTATEDNMAFSFPQDPSVKSATIPVVVEVQLLSMIGVTKKTGFVIADRIRKNLISLFSEKKERGDVLVIVGSQGRIADFAPRY